MTHTVTRPMIGFLGQNIVFEFDGVESPLVYRLNYSAPGSGWTLLPYTSQGTTTLTVQSVGWYSVGSTSFNPTTNSIVENRFEGQFLAFDPLQAETFIENRTGRLALNVYDSTISMQSAQSDWRTSINSWTEFASYVDAQFTAATPANPAFTAAQAKSFFFLQWVSGLWAYGNPTQVLLPGCVVNNELTGQIASADVTIRTFLDSPIGCCTDYTTVLSFLLLSAGIESRVVSGAGHVFNEALIDGQWWTLDANLGQAYRGTWNDVLDLNRTIEVIRFDHAGMTAGSPVFREQLVDFYNTFTQMVEVGSFPDGYRRDPVSFYESLDYGHTFLDEAPLVGWYGSGTSWTGSLKAPTYWSVGDFNADGKADAVTTLANGSGAQIFVSNGLELTAGATTVTFDPGTKKWITGDFNGDGSSDILAYLPGVSSAFVSLSGPTGFSAGSSWTSETDDDFGWWRGDFNGDGRTDIFRMINGVTGAEVFLSTGTQFSSAGSWTGAGSGSQSWYVGDFDGDGKDDVARYTVGIGTQVFRSTGSSFVYDAVWSTEGQGSDSQWYVGDFDGDGRDDLGRNIDGVGFQYLASTGTQFGTATLLAATDRLLDNILVGDFDGSGHDDIMWSNRTFNNGQVQSITAAPDLSGLSVQSVNWLTSFTPARLNLANVDSPVSLAASSNAWRPASLDTLDELYSSISQAQNAASGASYLAHWPADQARVFYFAQWISGLWRLGDTATEPETVSDNSFTGTVPALQTLARTFIAAPVGSIADAATLFAAMLSRAGIQNNVVTAGDYTINEVSIGGQWWSICVSLGIAIQGTWDAVINTATSPSGFVFDTASMREGSATQTELAAEMQHDFILKAGSGLLFEYTRISGTAWIAARPDANVFTNFLANNGLADTVTGTTGNDVLTTNGGNDILYGLGGSDRLHGMGGSDIMYGGSGDDWYYVDASTDVAREVAGEGYDTIFTSTSYSIEPGSDIEMLRTMDPNGATPLDMTGNEVANTIIGNAAANFIRGEGGNDTLSGLDGDDILHGGAGADRLVGGRGNDYYYADNPSDIVIELFGQGIDVIYTTVSYALRAGSEIEELRVFDPNSTNTVNFTGNEANNTFVGNLGANKMAGGLGNDNYYVNSTADVVLEYAAGGFDIVYTTASYTLNSSEIEELRTVLPLATSAIDLSGNALANAVVGNNGANLLRGFGGNDTLIGNGGNDTLVGGVGNDDMYGGAGSDSYYVDAASDRVIEASGEGTDTVFTTVSFTLEAGSEVEVVRTTNSALATPINLTGNEFNNTLFGNAAANSMNGGAADDVLIGYGGSDILTGGTGNDRLFGGEGNDTLSGGSGSDRFYFDTAPSAANRDTITDFSVLDDRIWLAASIFPGLATGGGVKQRFCNRSLRDDERTPSDL